MIKIIVHITNSKRNMYGNCYYFVSLQRVCDSKILLGTVAVGGNVPHYLRCAGFEWDELSLHEQELPIREFDRVTKAMNHLDEKQIIAFAKA